MSEADKAHVQRHRDAIDDYLDTVRALYAFARSACWDKEERGLRSGAHHAVPRRMDQGSTGKEVTPDAVVQVSGSYGVVAEAKKHFPEANSGRVFDQLRKYDDDLVGWWTDNEELGLYDLALLVHQFSSVSASDAFRVWREHGGELGRNLAVVEFGLVQAGQPWFLLKRVEGTLGRPDYDEALRKGVKLGKEALRPIIAKYKFTDDDPPLMHMMHLIHDYIFPLYPKEEEFEAATGRRTISVTVTANNLRQRMEDQFCDPRGGDRRRFRLPRRRWVIDAMEHFRQIGLAVQTEDKPLTYQVKLVRPGNRDTIEYLAELLAKAERATEVLDPLQEELFSASEEHKGDAESNGA